jgi:hypothetical protein
VLTSDVINHVMVKKKKVYQARQQIENEEEYVGDL